MRTLRTLLVAAGLVIAAAGPAAAAPPSTDHPTNAKAAAAWLSTQVNAQGFIESSFTPGAPDLSTTAQAVPALVAAGVGGTTITKLLDYLGAHVSDFAVDDTDPLNPVDKPGALAYLVLAAEAGGADPTAFGTPATDLVARLHATEQTSGNDAGLFGSGSPTFDGAFREGLAFLALDTAGETPSATAIAWLADQQCDSGLWMAYRADTSVACSTPDPADFTSPDTNSTALGVLAMHSVGAGGAVAATAGANALKAVRNSGGGWGLSAAAAQPTDANSTGLVADALLATGGTPDAAALAAIESLQLGCDADAADRGGIAFQDFGSGLLPDAFATVQAVPALAGASLPIANRTVTSGVPDVCAPVTPTTVTPTTVTPTTGGSTTTTPTTSNGSTTTTAGGAVARESALARTGSSDGPASVVALTLIGGGVGLVAAGNRRRRSSVPRS